MRGGNQAQPPLVPPERFRTGKWGLGVQALLSFSESIHAPAHRASRVDENHDSLILRPCGIDTKGLR